MRKSCLITLPGFGLRAGAGKRSRSLPNPNGTTIGRDRLFARIFLHERLRRAILETLDANSLWFSSIR
ncbi:MAG: hypothetical protein F6J93_35200 [Oscillatoria sp. SIO1A7]|nr:hypothetical protein [Oscillatoria sp. SIO1A7]